MNSFGFALNFLTFTFLFCYLTSRFCHETNIGSVLKCTEWHRKEKGTTKYLTLALPLHLGTRISERREAKLKTNKQKAQNLEISEFEGKPQKFKNYTGDFALLNIRFFFHFYLKRCHKCYSIFASWTVLCSSMSHQQEAGVCAGSHPACRRESVIWGTTMKGTN